MAVIGENQIIPKFLTLKSFVEGKFIQFVIDSLPSITSNEPFEIKTEIEVFRPFGHKIKRKNGKSRIKPEICLVTQSKSFGLVAEVAAWNDHTNNPDPNWSESHHKILQDCGSSCDGYFAQKVMCQLFPVYVHLIKAQTKRVLSYFNCTINHERLIINVLNYLKKINYISSWTRVLEYNCIDVSIYHQQIYLMQFPDDIDSIVAKLDC